jgi:hypothetical protein
LGTRDVLKVVKQNANLDLFIASVVEQLLKEYKDIFAWTCKDLRSIPYHLTKHQIELDTNILASHQARYWMNSNYAAIMKHDLNKLLAARFIVPMEEATWLSPIVVVPKKNRKFRICMDIQKLNIATKKEPYPLPFMEEVLNMLARHEIYSFLDDFRVIIR